MGLRSQDRGIEPEIIGHPRLQNRRAEILFIPTIIIDPSHLSHVPHCSSSPPRSYACRKMSALLTKRHFWSSKNQSSFPVPLLPDFARTAEIISTLDLIITVDSCVAHLAGALGKPVWVLLPYAPDWRWLLDREDSPWYPTARLFRQNESREWPHSISQVCEQVHRVINLGSLSRVTNFRAAAGLTRSSLVSALETARASNHTAAYFQYEHNTTAPFPSHNVPIISPADPSSITRFYHSWVALRYNGPSVRPLLF